MTQVLPLPASVAELTEQLRTTGYIADRGLATATHLAVQLGRPLLLEGEVGVGKTELAKTLAELFGRRLIRLQCFEGIDSGQALYEWDYARQMLAVRATTAHDAVAADAVRGLFTQEFLIERPLLEAVREGDQCVLLIDEIDRADDEFEAFLLELLSDFQITVPELGTIGGPSRPIVILTSNRTRELHDALKRRCMYHWIGFPSVNREIEIIMARIPSAGQRMAERVVSAVNRLRDMDLAKPPGVAETIDWVTALDVIGSTDLTAESALDTLGSVLKDRDDIELASSSIDHVVDSN
ncbi:MAG: AAA family ATPase [Ilumatobacteraceae bacterium]